MMRHRLRAGRVTGAVVSLALFAAATASAAAEADVEDDVVVVVVVVVVVEDTGVKESPRSLGNTGVQGRLRHIHTTHLLSHLINPSVFIVHSTPV